MIKIFEITRYSVQNKCLTPWVKFIWQLNTRNADYHYKLLPTDCIDVILNLESEMVYETESGQFIAPPFHINGLRSKSSFIHQKSNVCAFGISFYPYGLFPFVHTSITGLQDKIISLGELSTDLEQKLRCAAFDNKPDEIVKAIEQVLVNELSVNQHFRDKARLIEIFLTVAKDMSVKNFCKEREINIKTFERIVLFYTGFTPKLLRDIRRFQNASNQLTHQCTDGLAEIAHDNNFADQTHFTKEFRRFSGVAPRTFQVEKITVKENVKYTYR